MNVFEAIFLGIIQGLTEFLPVSSSGHLNICQHILGVSEGNLFFDVMLHIGTLAAVIAVYVRLVGRLFKALVRVCKKIFTKQFKLKELDGEENLAFMIIVGLLPLFVMFLPIGNGMKLKDLADVFAKDGYFIVVGLSLLATSALLYIGNKQSQKYGDGKDGKKKARRRYKIPDAVIVGFTQCLAALFPGLSRSGSTLAASQLRGMDKKIALDYSFLLGTPAIVAAALLEGKDALFPKDGQAVTIDYFPVIIGMLFAAVVGFIAIKLFKWLLSTDKMYVFIIYTAIVGAIVLIISIIELATGENMFTHNTLVF